jgi:hypothetical protein
MQEILQIQMSHQERYICFIKYSPIYANSINQNRRMAYSHEAHFLARYQNKEILHLHILIADY